jgi:hypothetical protein
MCANICNIQIEHLQLKHLLQRKIRADKTFQTYYCNICEKTYATSRSKRLQHTTGTDETFWTNSCNMSLKHLQHTQHVQHSQSIFATSIWNNCNIALKRLKHLKYTFATYERRSLCQLIPAVGDWRRVMTFYIGFLRSLVKSPLSLSLDMDESVCLCVVSLSRPPGATHMAGSEIHVHTYIHTYSIWIYDPAACMHARGDYYPYSCCVVAHAVSVSGC